MDGTMAADRLQEKVAGICLIVGVLLMPPVTIFEYSDGGLFGSGALGLLLYAVLLPGLLGVARLLRRSAPRLSVIVGLLAIFGCVSGATFQTANLHEWAARTAGTPEALMATILSLTEERVFPVLIILGICFPISLLTLAIGLFRSGVIPVWMAVLLGIGAAAFPLGHIGQIQVVSHVAETLMLIPLVWISLRFLIGATPRPIVAPATA